MAFRRLHSANNDRLTSARRPPPCTHSKTMMSGSTMEFELLSMPYSRACLQWRLWQEHTGDQPVVQQEGS